MTAPVDHVPERRQRVARRVLVIILLLFGLWIIRSFLPALAWAGVIAIAIAPLYARAARRWPHLQRHAILPSLTVAAVALLVLVPIGLGVARAAAEAGQLSTWIATVRNTGIPVPAWVNELPFGRLTVMNWWQVHLATPDAMHAEFARFGSQNFVYQGKMLGRGIVHRGVIFMFTLIALFFMLRDSDLLVEQLRRAGRRAFGASSERIGRQIVASVRGTIDGLVLVGIGEGAAMAVAYVLFGVPQPLLLGVATAIAAMIPFGASVMFGIAAITLLLKGSLVGAIVVFVIGLVVVTIADHFVRPVLIGGVTKLPFVWVLIGILGGVETMGLIGLFVGPATMAVLVMIWRDYVEQPVDPMPPPPAELLL